MPTYLLHGFRWPRPLIRIHIILQNLDDAAAEWLVAPDTTMALLKNFHHLYPESMAHLNRLRFVEQYDPDDSSPGASASQPFAYVADVVHEVKLGVAVDDVVSGGINNEQWSAMMELRDKLAPEEKVSWFIVVCGDEERWAPPTMSLLEPSDEPQSLQRSSGSESAGSVEAPQRGVQLQDAPVRAPPQKQDSSRGITKLFNSTRLGRRKSRQSFHDIVRSRSSHSIPAVPYQYTTASKPPVAGTTVSAFQKEQGSMANGRSSDASAPKSHSPSGPANGHLSESTNGHLSDRSPPDSAGNSTGGDGSFGKPSISPPAAEQGRPRYSDTPPSSQGGTRRSTIGVAAIPDLGPESLATRWNPSGTEPAFEHRVSRRLSNVPAFSNSPRANSPEMKRSYSPVSAFRGQHGNGSSPNRNGAMSPVSTLRHETMRSSSPLRGELVSPTVLSPTGSSQRGWSPIRGVGHFARNGNAFAMQEEARHAATEQQKALAALQGQTPLSATPSRESLHSAAPKDKQRLSLVTQMPHQPPVPEEDEEDEELDIIAMSPAAHTPVMRFRQSRSSLALSQYNPSSSQINLSGLNLTSGPDKPYFGQAINQHDLVASGMDNAFNRL